MEVDKRSLKDIASDLEAILETVKKELRALESDGPDSVAFLDAAMEFYVVSCGRKYHLVCPVSRDVGASCDAKEMVSALSETRKKIHP